ncbi:MAG: flavin reductase family protein [Polyangiaceae bacterium]|nr:flavin reductase family protein [Polyangiaceae bacterium]
MQFDPNTLDEARVHHLMADSIVPRPIAWVTTRNEDGSTNLAPFSFFMGICPDPPLCAIAVSQRERGDVLEVKDTRRNIERTGELVIHTVPAAQLELMNQSSADHAYGVDELELVGLTALPCEQVDVARIAEAPIAMECRAGRTLELGDSATALIVCRIVLWHVADAIVSAGRIDFDKLDAVGRIGTTGYSYTRKRIKLARPRL